MSWIVFKQNVLNTMYLPPASTDVLASVIANSYDMAVKTPPARDVLIGNYITNGNLKGLEEHIKGVFNLQKASVVPLPLVNLISLGFTIYWSGAQLSNLVVPPPTPLIQYTNVISNNVVFPGLPVKQSFPLGIPQTSEQFVDNLIDAAKLHLLTISGVMTLNCIYPSIPTPIYGTSILPWVGYFVPYEKDKKIEEDDIFVPITIGFLYEKYKNNNDLAKIIAFLIYKRDKKTQFLPNQAPSLLSIEDNADEEISNIKKQIYNQTSNDVVYRWYELGKSLKIQKYFETTEELQILFKID